MLSSSLVTSPTLAVSQLFLLSPNKVIKMIREFQRSLSNWGRRLINKDIHGPLEVYQVWCRSNDKCERTVTCDLISRSKEQFPHWNWVRKKLERVSWKMKRPWQHMKKRDDDEPANIMRLVNKITKSSSWSMKTTFEEWNSDMRDKDNWETEEDAKITSHANEGRDKWIQRRLKRQHRSKINTWLLWDNSSEVNTFSSCVPKRIVVFYR